MANETELSEKEQYSSQQGVAKKKGSYKNIRTFSFSWTVLPRVFEMEAMFFKNAGPGCLQTLQARCRNFLQN